MNRKVLCNSTLIENWSKWIIWKILQELSLCTDCSWFQKRHGSNYSWHCNLLGTSHHCNMKRISKQHKNKLLSVIRILNYCWDWTSTYPTIKLVGSKHARKELFLQFSLVLDNPHPSACVEGSHSKFIPKVKKSVGLINLFNDIIYVTYHMQSKQKYDSVSFKKSDKQWFSSLYLIGPDLTSFMHLQCKRVTNTTKKPQIVQG